METNSTVHKPSIERVQIQKMASISFILNSVAAFPGFIGTIMLFVVALNELSPKTSTLTLSNWLTFGPLFEVMLLGWWLYVTYWLELANANRYKSSWLVSTLLNLAGVIFTLSRLVASDTVGLSIVILVWCFVMMFISARVWMLRLKERV